jgi:signal transduction histidine kinase
MTAVPAGSSGGGASEDPTPWAILDSLDVGVVLLTSDLRITYANALWSAWVGGDVAPGTSVGSMIGDSASLAAFRSALADGEPRHLVLTVQPVQVDLCSRRLQCTVRRVPPGLVVEGHAEVDDERAALQDVGRRLAEVTDMAEVLRTLCDLAARQCQATGAAVLRLTSSTGEIVAATGDLLAARGRCFDADGSLLKEALQRGEAVAEVNFLESGRPLMRAMPELLVGPVLAVPLRAHGDSLGVLAITRAAGGRAFSEREMERLRLLADHAALAVHKSLLLQQAQSADRAKGRFLATMSHELRTPLTALAGYGELLADQVIGPLSEPQLDILERMRSVTSHLSAMIEEILSFTSLEEGREIVRPSEFLADDLVRAALAVVEPQAQQKAIALELHMPDKAVRVTGDIDKARQILVNLLGNAVKFTDRGSVSVTLTRAPRSVRIAITDTGMGIPPEELSRLFRPFAQVDTGLTRRHGGTGLGLYISRRLASLLGGHIEVESAPGAGSTFSVILPLLWEPTRSA